MTNIFKPRRVASGLLVACALVAACGELRPPTGPPPPGLPPPPPVQGPSPTITAITPATGSTGGGASMRIVGSNFRPGTVASFDGIKVGGRFDSRDTYFTNMFVETPPHPEGTIDIEVINADGTSTRLVGGHTYLPAASFDFNGAWGGYPGNGDDRRMSFTIANGRLVSAACDTDIFATVSIPLESNVPVTGGEFSVNAGERVVVAGRIVSATEAVGRMDFDTCSTIWRATRQTSLKRP